MFEVIRWVSIVLLWIVMGLNIAVMIRGVRLNKRLQVERKYCLTMMRACNEFLESKGVEVDLTEEDNEK